MPPRSWTWTPGADTNLLPARSTLVPRAIRPAGDAGRLRRRHAWGSDGTTYHLKSVELRIYRGQFTTEPANEVPLVEFSQSFGNRTGQGEAMECLVISYNPDHNATAFEYATVTSNS